MHSHSCSSYWGVVSQIEETFNVKSTTWEGTGSVVTSRFYDSGHCRRMNVLTHTYTHGRWQSIMGEIGTQSHTHFPSLSLKHTAHRDIHTRICMNEPTHTHTFCASEAQDEARLTAAMSYSAMVTILAEEIKYLKLLFDKKTHLSLKYCAPLP